MVDTFAMNLITGLGSSMLQFLEKFFNLNRDSEETKYYWPDLRFIRKGIKIYVSKESEGKGEGQKGIIGSVKKDCFEIEMSLRAEDLIFEHKENLYCRVPLKNKIGSFKACVKKVVKKDRKVIFELCNPNKVVWRFEEKRKDPRVKLKVPAETTISGKADAQAAPAVLYDISAGGVGFYSSADYMIHDRIILRVDLKETTLELPALIVRSLRYDSVEDKISYNNMYGAKLVDLTLNDTKAVQKIVDYFTSKMKNRTA